MAEDIGYISKENGDLDFENGSFKKADCTQQNVDRLLLLEKGDLRQYPTLGVGITEYLNAPENTRELVKLRKDIRTNLDIDGAKIRKLSVPNYRNIEIVVEYNE